MVSERYSRQVKVIGNEAQEQLQKSSVLIIGCGGLGCPISLYLSTAGVGSLTLVDDDIVSMSNLHRQVLFGEDDIGLSKVEVASTKLKKLNSNVNIADYHTRLNKENSSSIIDGHDLVIIGCDNFETRFIVSESCQRLQVPYINASVLGDEGAITFFDVQGGCYQCLYPDLDVLNVIPTPSSIGVLGPMVGVIGASASTMALQILIGKKEKYLNKIFSFDSDTLLMKSFYYDKNENCINCK
ncbi:hypothetical protein BCU75_14475 [Vibrio splendidus]|nr:hypothetical protein BCU75_14475 [Vibrio splendidus]